MSPCTKLNARNELVGAADTGTVPVCTRWRFELFEIYLDNFLFDRTLRSRVFEMLRRRRGGGRTSRKMAKKTVPAALQTEVTSDDEWAKILERKGLVVVDVYSEWCGPCTGMVSILKKVKMEIGGDALSYATARCDCISDLRRFQGKSEPIWMFVHDGKMVNLMFGAQYPQFMKMLTTELRRVQNGEEHEFSVSASECSPQEKERTRIEEETKIAKETAKKIQKEAEAKARHEAETNHFTTSLRNETCILLYPWVFKDEEGHRRDKKSSPPYVELIEEILPGNFSVEQEIRRRLNEDALNKIFDESSEYILTEDTKQLLLDGKCMFMRLKAAESKTDDDDIHKYLLHLLFDKPELPRPNECPSGECYGTRHKPASIPIEKENGVFPVAWTPIDPENKVAIFRLIFNTYTNTTYPYEDKTARAPIIVFKYDSTRKNELKMVLQMFDDEVVDFGVFDCDKTPNAKMVAKSIEEFETSVEEKTGYEIFVCTVKKTGCEAFLGFAGIGPFHVSDNPENAIEESKLYFPRMNISEEVQSDDEDKLEDKLEDTPENAEIMENNDTARL